MPQLQRNSPPKSEHTQTEVQVCASLGLSVQSDYACWHQTNRKDHAILPAVPVTVAGIWFSAPHQMEGLRR